MPEPVAPAAPSTPRLAIAPLVPAKTLAQLAACLADVTVDYGLTLRECETLAHLMQGHTNAEIARRLCIAEETVKTHVRHVLERLKAVNRTHAVAIVLGAAIKVEGRVPLAS